jgi:hypothetical protein
MTKPLIWCMLAGSKTLFYSRQVRKHVDLASSMYPFWQRVSNVGFRIVVIDKNIAANDTAGDQN